MNKEVLVVDLDGTLYATNTFHRYIKYLFLRSVESMDLILSFQILICVFFRILRIISHSKFKYYVLLFSTNKSYINSTEFIQSINVYARDLSGLYDKTYDLRILATAAPASYSKEIAFKYKFDVCIATEMSDTEYSPAFENAKENKRENVVNFLNSRGLKTIDLLITDHSDDLALIKISKNNIIINPDEKFKKELQSLDIQYKVVNIL
ncbi:haloacid dehalogenase-like hydrolase [Aestuariivivens sediminis]|uniref:haloacid dehalogenase-like hydrolase n=1 Tax=Aestuariivivens sediminis TaxID=2913557 RepID=UPI001F5829CF|nr:haloacid dehalogenase-like hydrolase [Aestuariivivens sediminis]